MTQPSAQTAYQTFIELLLEAQQATQAVDDFDLHSEIPESVATWKELLLEEHQAIVALVAHTKSSADEITRFSEEGISG